MPKLLLAQDHQSLCTWLHPTNGLWNALPMTYGFPRSVSFCEITGGWWRAYALLVDLTSRMAGDIFRTV